MSESKDVITIVEEFKNIEELNRAKKKGLQTIASMEIIGLLRSTISKIENSSSLKDMIEAKLVALISDSEEELTPAALLRFYELLLKHETEATAPILKILEASVKTQEQAEILQLQQGGNNGASSHTVYNGDSNSSSGTSDNGITAKDIQEIKELLPKLEKLSEIFDSIEDIEKTEK